MGLGQIDYVDIVADRRSVRRVVVVAEYAQALADTGRRLRDERDQIARYALGKLADQCRGVRSDRIEVAKRYPAQLGISRHRIAQNILAYLLRVAVRRRGRLPRRLLGDRQRFGLAVHGARRREDKIAYPFLPHQVEHVEQRQDIVAVIE